MLGPRSGPVARVIPGRELGVRRHPIPFDYEVRWRHSSVYTLDTFYVACLNVRSQEADIPPTLAHMSSFGNVVAPSSRGLMDCRRSSFGSAS